MLRLVGEERLELSHLAALVPKTSVYTNFTTRPYVIPSQYNTVKNFRRLYFFRRLYVIVRAHRNFKWLG